MSGGVTTYQVVDPVFPWELRSRLLHAADTGTRATFSAIAIDELTEPTNEQPKYVFTVDIDAAQFKKPVAFDVTDSEGRIFQIKLHEFGPVEFDVFT